MKSPPITDDTDAPSLPKSDGRRSEGAVPPAEALDDVSGPASLLQTGPESGSATVVVGPAVRVDAGRLPEGEGSSAPFPEEAAPFNHWTDTGRSVPDGIGMLPTQAAASAPEPPEGLPMPPVAPQVERRSILRACEHTSVSYTHLTLPTNREV